MRLSSYRRLATGIGAVAALAFLCVPIAAGADTVMRPGTYAGLWHSDKAQYTIDKVNADLSFAGSATLLDGINKGYVITFTGKLNRGNGIVLTRTDKYPQGDDLVGQTIVQESRAEAPESTDQAYVWKGRTTGGNAREKYLNDQVYAFELRVPKAAGLKDTGPALTAEQTDLIKLINDYRVANGLPAIPASKKLSLVAQTHVQDMAAKQRLTHDWSKSDKWTSGYDTNPKVMWDKPKEIAGYQSDGYENAAMRSGGQITAAQALEQWKGDAPHRDVILNQGTWKGRTWKALGVALYNGYASMWVGEVADPD